MRVAVDSGPLTNGHSVRGIGLYARELIKTLEIEKKAYKDVKIKTVDFSKSNLTNYDVVHYLSFNPLHLTLPLRKPAKIVVTIHDLIPLIYPNIYPPGIRGKVRYLIQKFLFKSVDVVITDSETSKKDIVRFFGVSAKKVKVIYLAPSKLFRVIKDKDRLNNVAKKYNLPDKFVFYLGDVNYTKNIVNLVKACEIANLKLVISGKNASEIEENTQTSIKNLAGPQDWVRFILGRPHPELSHYVELKKLLDKNDNIRRLGYVNDEDLALIFNLATVYCQPSFYEGFGFSVLHAFASEIPVVISKTNCLVEIAGKSALIVDPNNPKDIAEKLTSLISDSSLRVSLIRKANERLKDLSWEKTARETIEVYKNISSE